MMACPCHFCPAQAAMPQHNPSVLPEKFLTTPPKHRGNLKYLNSASTIPKSFDLWSIQTRTHSTNQRLPRKAGKRKKQPRNLTVSLRLHSWHRDCYLCQQERACQSRFPNNARHYVVDNPLGQTTECFSKRLQSSELVALHIVRPRALISIIVA
jgi:hypothetical protein